MPPRRHRLFVDMITVKNVVFSYAPGRTPPVINDVSFTVGEGEELAIIGGNGSGKTTLGLLLCGAVMPTVGQILIDGRQAAMSDEKPIVGFLFQDPDNGLVATTVEREVAFSLENRNLPAERIRRTVDHTLDLFGMTAFRERLIWNLSGGEKQRLSLAALFAFGARILFLDEPVSYLDRPGAQQLEAMLQEVKAADPAVTIVRVTQFPLVADRYPRLMVMQDGKVIRDGPPQDVFSDVESLRHTGIRPPLAYLAPRNGIPAHRKKVGRAFDETVLTLDHISFSFASPANGNKDLLDDLSLAVYTGEVLGVVGPSGSGKSTLAQILCGIYDPSSGKISFDRPDRRCVMSFQQPERQFFLDTVYDEVQYGMTKNTQSVTSIDSIVRGSLETAGLAYDIFKDRDPHTLSGGEARRLGFAIVLALDADVIIFDEPACGLDEAGIGAFREMVTHMTQNGKTVIIISHNSDLISDLADRVALLSGGRIACVLPARDFFLGEQHKAALLTPEVIAYQHSHFGDVTTTRIEDIFDLSPFYA
jgi:energy-coupling factor transporter ATP-binding protein EcfA2